MTIQNWTLTNEAAAIYCDTLATGGVHNSPSAFMEKVWVVPHRSIMIAALDWAYPAQTLYSQLALGYAPTELNDLVQYASEQFRMACVDGSRVASGDLTIWRIGRVQSCVRPVDAAVCDCWP